MAVRQAAATFQVSIAYIYKALIRRRLTGDTGISPNRGRPPRKLSPEHELVLATHIREECRAFLEGNLKLTLNMDKTHITHVDDGFVFLGHRIIRRRSEEHTSELQSLMRNSYAVFCLKKKNRK